MILKKSLLPLKHANIDTFILGKMEFSLAAQEIGRKLPKHCQVIDPSVSLLQEVSDYLEEADKDFKKNGTLEFSLFEFFLLAQKNHILGQFPPEESYRFPQKKLQSLQLLTLE